MNTPNRQLPDELYIEATNRCNSRCQTCIRTHAELEPLRDLTLDEFRSLVDQIPILQRVVLHGVGESLLNDDLPAMIVHLKAGARPPRVVFNSNALLLTPRKRQALIDAGLDEFRVSTDAAHRELYAQIRGVDGFEQMVTNVRAFTQQIGHGEHGPRVSLWFTAMRHNLADLPNLVRLAHRLGVSEVYVQRLVFYGQGLAVRQQSLFRARHSGETARLDRLLREAGSLANALGISLRASGATSPDESLSPSDSSRPWSHCRRPSSLMYITANGNVLPCCFSPFTTHDYAELILGNAFQTPLSEIWNGPKYTHFRAALQTDAPPEACDRCGVCWSL